MITLSIVSHLQFELVKLLLDDLEKYCVDNIPFEVILTCNLPEKLPQNFDRYHYKIKVISNTIPMGYGANHNQAFHCSEYNYFCVLNPDIRLINNPFTKLLDCLQSHQKIGVIAPQIVNEKNQSEDNARQFLTPIRLFKRILFGKKLEFDVHQNEIIPDWVAGMFMLFPAQSYNEVNGFDERYFMYCEDMDICFRLKQKAYQAFCISEVKVIHESKRDSHKKVKYFYWHIVSLMKFFVKTHFGAKL